MDWSTPYRADVEVCCQLLWRLGQELDTVHLPAALQQTCQALRRWLLQPLHHPDARQQLLRALADLERLRQQVAAAAQQSDDVSMLCTQLHDVILLLLAGL